MAHQKQSSFFLLVGVVLLTLLQMFTNGSAIYENLIVYQNPAGIREFQWINFSAGLGTGLWVILLLSKLRKTPKKNHVLLALLLINGLLIVLQWVFFFHRFDFNIR